MGTVPAWVCSSLGHVLTALFDADIATTKSRVWTACPTVTCTTSWTPVQPTRAGRGTTARPPATSAQGRLPPPPWSQPRRKPALCSHRKQPPPLSHQPAPPLAQTTETPVTTEKGTADKNHDDGWRSTH
ncbi:uncharacterized protein LOC127834176 [Dreissena polymorpha]|uniref:Secreted protein n=1 Tax=Dreissena polymorpha TaxID=45954 RepID=A0A9D4FVR2_DREPO|nr:uncharacterized protein LOC127834176 [Dreissena polymorpha]KAH3803966.1 hypothetical protein DPMN_132238 [Dreissena polymorpha]